MVSLLKKLLVAILGVVVVSSVIPLFRLPYQEGIHGISGGPNFTQTNSCVMPQQYVNSFEMYGLVPINQPSIDSTQLTDSWKSDMIWPGVVEVYGGLEEFVVDGVHGMLFFPENVVADVLSRLAVKPLFRLRSVCKDWHSLIDTQFFIKLHLKKTKELQAHRKLFQQGYFTEMYTVDFQCIEKTNIAEIVAVPHPFGPVGLINFCDGLVCVSHKEGDNLAIWNPSTRRHRILPRLGSGVLPNRSNRDFRCKWLCGFGKDVLHDDYKVLVIKQSESENYTSLLFSSEVYVYSLKANLWRELDPFPYHLKRLRCPGVPAGGALHCVVGKRPWCGNEWIAAIDLATEKYRIVPQPDYPSKVENFTSWDLGNLGGCLSMIWKYKKEYMLIWVLKEYGKPDSWTLITRIEASDFMRTIEYSVGGEELILETIPANSMVRYNIEKQLANDVEIRGQIDDHIYSHVYHESLVQLNNGTGPSVSWPEVAPEVDVLDMFLEFGFRHIL